MSQVVLINANILKPPVSPVGLEYVAESLTGAGFSVKPIDLCFEDSWQSALRDGLKNTDALFIGVSVRNTDDCCWATKKTFIPWIREVVIEIKKLSAAPVLLGGVGFSIMPGVVLRTTGAEYGVVGDGEDAITFFARCLIQKNSPEDIPNLVFWKDDRVVCNSRKVVSLKDIPPNRRNIFNNLKYEQFGAMVGIETKRGCVSQCIYCADPVAKGRTTRLRPPKTVAQEFQNLVDQGITWFHICDSEFNLPIDHAKEVCRILIERKLGDRVHWYTYCSPAPFDKELLYLMQTAGCSGINFGVDSLVDEQLARLGRNYSSHQIKDLTLMLNNDHFNYIFDLMVGGPGETELTVEQTVERVIQFGVQRAGIAIGLRVYPDTKLESQLNAGLMSNRLKIENSRPGELLYYLSPDLPDDIVGLVNKLVGGDRRFMLLSNPGEQGSYNYAGDEQLSKLITGGARGAYWDILSRARHP